MKYLWIVFLLMVLISISSCAKDKVQFEHISILIDQTVEDKFQVETYLDEIQYYFANQIKANESWILNKKITFEWINDRGEGPYIHEILVPNSKGIQKRNIKSAFLQIKQAISEIKEHLKKDQTIYNKTYIIEPLLRALKKSTFVFIISDMALVDDRHNFEKMKYGNPIDLAQIAMKRKVQIFRVGRHRQSYEQINLVDSWWKSSLYGIHTDWNNLQKKSLAIKKDSSDLRKSRLNDKTKYLYVRWIRERRAKMLKCNKIGSGVVNLSISLHTNTFPIVSIKSSENALSQCAKNVLENEKFNYQATIKNADQRFVFTKMEGL